MMIAYYVRSPQMHASAIMRTVGMFIENMDNIQAVVPVLARLGSTHALLGVRPAFFKEFRASFIEAVKEDLGRERFTAEVETAWCTAIDTITSIIVSNYPRADSAGLEDALHEVDRRLP